MYQATTDARSQAIIAWLTDQLHLDIRNFEPASSDASFRRYFRVEHAAGRHIIMDAPPDKENTEPFIRIAGLMREANIHVPAIYQHNLNEGFLLLEDLGSECFLDRLDEDNADSLYRSALNSLFKLQSLTGLAPYRLPSYDRALLQRELDLFGQWFIGDLLGITLPVDLKRSLDAQLIDSALEQPMVCVHRDYHSRNLMLAGTHLPGVIDFQDAVIGPVSYDPVSLLRDCYISWPLPRVERWMEEYYWRLRDEELVSVDLGRFRRWFDLMGLQRHLKAIGIFARLHLRDNKSGYLADIPRTMNYVTQVCAVYSELSDFSRFLHQHVLPLYQDKLCMP